MQGYKLFWGDSHTNLHLGRSGWSQARAVKDAHTNLPTEHAADLGVALRHARQVLDFWPIAYYPYTYREMNGFTVETWLAEPQLQAGWQAVCDLAARYNEPGRLVIFPGYEWQGDGRHGDHNVFFLRDHPPLLRCDRLDELYAEICRRELAAYAIPHHTAYLPGVRSKDWSVHDEAISPFAEVFSNHGSSESDEEAVGLRRNWHMGPGVSGSTIEEALGRGIKTGIIASNDSHYGVPGVHGMGLMACYARQLTRESLWEAFAARRVYGVTGDRIELDFTVEDAVMGQAVRKAGPVRARVRVCGGDAIDRIELLRNNRVIATHCHSGAWAPPTGQEPVRCKLRVEVGWGPKTSDVPGLPPRDWQCSIEIADGAVLSAEPCWRTAGQSIGQTGGRRCEYGFRTLQDPPHGQVPTEATIFELGGRPADVVTLRLEGQSVRMTLAEAMAGSRIVHFIGEAADFVRKTYGIDPARLKRKDRIYFLSHKAKVHRAIPESGFSAELDHLDAHPPGGENFYRVRVLQRNGQAAWSSPIWVDNS